jgi:hypothetical protein
VNTDKTGVTKVTSKDGGIIYFNEGENKFLKNIR